MKARFPPVGVTLHYLSRGRYSFNFPSPEELQAFRPDRAGFASPEAAARACRRMEQLMYPYEIIQREQPVPILQRDHTVPADLAAAVDRAVCKDRNAGSSPATIFAVRCWMHPYPLDYSIGF